MGLSPGPASTVLRFLRGGCDGCLCGRLCEPCRDAGESGYSEGTVERVTPERVVLTVDRHANTSAASVPLALDVAVQDGRIKQGDLVVLEAMGGGFTWGAAAIRF